MDRQGNMILLVAVVQREDAPGLIAEVNRRGHRATRISASGGFLSVGNDVVLVGVEESLVPDVIDAIHETCRTRTAYAFHSSGDFTLDGTIGPIEVEVGGAVIFTLPVERFVRLKGRQPIRASAQKRAV